MAVTVNQMGKRLEMCRPRDRQDCFKPSPFSLILISEDGQIIGTSREHTMSNFFHSLLIHKEVIHSGTYTLVVDVCWDDSIHYDAGFDDVQVRVFTTEKAPLIPLDLNVGNEILANALKQEAKKGKNKEFRNYYRE